MTIRKAIQCFLAAKAGRELLILEQEPLAYQFNDYKVYFDQLLPNISSLEDGGWNITVAVPKWMVK